MDVYVTFKALKGKTLPWICQRKLADFLKWNHSTPFALNFDKFQWHLPWFPSFRCCINTEPGNKTVLEVRLRMILFVGGIRWAVGLTSLMDLALNTRRELVRKELRTFETGSNFSWCTLEESRSVSKLPPPVPPRPSIDKNYLLTDKSIFLNYKLSTARTTQRDFYPYLILSW